MPRTVQFVIKVSKHCNLRCRYCYEYPNLSNKETMSLEQLERIYSHIASWYRGLNHPATVEFVWHGGEPMLMDPGFYRQTFEAQKTIFGEHAASIRNTVQTNLTFLDDERIRLLRDGFDDMGVSIDLFGGLRVNVAGADSVNKVLQNMDRLRANNVGFGCITVLSKANLDSVSKIVRFYHKFKPLAVRFLPLFDGASADQHEGYDVTPEQILTALKTVFDELLALDCGFPVEPIRQMITQVLQHHIPGSVPSYYNKRVWEPIYVVDMNGDLYNFAENYRPDFCHGNLIDTPLEQMIDSRGHIRAIEAAERRVEAVCRNCKFYGSCDGFAVAEDYGQHEMAEPTPNCTVWRGMLEYITERLFQMGLIDPVTGTVAFYRAPTVVKQSEDITLRLDAQIHFPDEDVVDAGSRIMLSAGTTPRVVQPSDGLNYLNFALVPKSPWRAPTAAESAILLGPRSPESWRLGSDVAIVRIPDEIIGPMEQIFDDYGTRTALPSIGHPDHTTHPGWQRAYALLTNHVKTAYSTHDHEPTFMRIHTGPPGMHTLTQDTAVNGAGNVYVGMHLDTWEKIELDKRDSARNRICINLGREDRYFLFINLTLARMYEALGTATTEKKDYYGKDLGHEFMRTFPDYPVLRLRLKPREAYIAPTDNLIHDASSFGKQFPDITMHILGYFGLAQGVPAAADLKSAKETFVQY